MLTVEQKAAVKQERTHMAKIRQLMSKTSKEEAAAACEALYLKHPNEYVMAMLKINSRNNLHRDTVINLVKGYEEFCKDIYGGE